jgi:hypothetical protein
MTTESRLIAKCGLDCTACPAYVATQNNDLEAKRKVAAEWSTPQFPLKAEEIYCDGCGTGGRVLSFCSMCDVLQCASARKVTNCAHCADYACDKLQKTWGALGGGEAKTNLDAIHTGLK